MNFLTQLATLVLNEQARALSKNQTNIDRMQQAVPTRQSGKWFVFLAPTYSEALLSSNRLIERKLELVQSCLLRLVPDKVSKLSAQKERERY